MMIEIIGKDNCNFCTQTKNLLESKHIEYNYINSSKLPPEQTQQIIETKAPQAKTFPIILIDEVYIGGFVDIKNLL